MVATRMEPHVTLSIRNPEADFLAKRLAKLDDSTITEAVIVALREAIAARIKREPAQETARKILERRGLAFVANRRPLPPEAYHELDHDLAGEG
jgi:antitoxin VapB